MRLLQPFISHSLQTNAGPDALAYDGPGTDKGNRYKVEKPLESYDEDNKLAIDLLTSLPNCTGRIGATGMCLGGHLALRSTLDPRVLAAVTFFGTDIHSKALGTTSDEKAHTLVRLNEIKAELIVIFGTYDPHVPAEGRDIVRKALRDADVFATFLEIAGAQHAFVRDEDSKGRYDPAVTGLCTNMLLELFNRRLKLDLGEKEGALKIDHVC